MTNHGADVTQNLRAASVRLWPAFSDEMASITVTPSASGLMATVRERDTGRIVFRIFEEMDTGTVWLVPSWVPSPEAMEEALDDRADRARLVVA